MFADVRLVGYHTPLKSLHSDKCYSLFFRGVSDDKRERFFQHWHLKTGESADAKISLRYRPVEPFEAFLPFQGRVVAAWIVWKVGLTCLDPWSTCLCSLKGRANHRYLRIDLDGKRPPCGFFFSCGYDHRQLMINLLLVVVKSKQKMLKLTF
jgi:hypothetical protein